MEVKTKQRHKSFAHVREFGYNGLIISGLLLFITTLLPAQFLPETRHVVATVCRVTLNLSLFSIFATLPFEVWTRSRRIAKHDIPNDGYLGKPLPRGDVGIRTPEEIQKNLRRDIQAYILTALILGAIVTPYLQSLARHSSR